MTIEEHIENLKAIASDMPSDKCSDWIESLMAGVKALEQETRKDLINRNELDKALYEYFHEEDSPNNITNVPLGMIRNFIKNFQSPVTPQYTDAEIQKMQDLEFAEIQKAYEIGKAENSNKWIPVSERLPEVGSEVLVCYDIKGKRSVYIADFYGDGKFYGYDDEYLTTEGRKYRKAVAWMPLPESYKASPTGAESEAQE